MGLSSRPAARARQLDNLNRGGHPAPAGNRRAVTHAGYASIVIEQLEAKEREVFAAIASDAPLREVGELPRADGVVVRLLAEVLCRLDSVSADIRAHGWRDRTTGEARPVIELEARLRREALDYCESLAMTPRARARVGVDLSRLVDEDFKWVESASREELEAYLADIDPSLVPSTGKGDD